MSQPWVCDGCHTEYAEYVNGCPKCSDRGLHFSVRQHAAQPAPRPTPEAPTQIVRALMSHGWLDSKNDQDILDAEKIVGKVLAEVRDTIHCPFCDSGLTLSEREVDAVCDLSKRLEISPGKVWHMALALFQLHTLGEPALVPKSSEVGDAPVAQSLPGARDIHVSDPRWKCQCKSCAPVAQPQYPSVTEEGSTGIGPLESAAPVAQPCCKCCDGTGRRSGGTHCPSCQGSGTEMPAAPSPAGERDSIAEHDREFPPRRPAESAGQFLERALREHRASHEEWIGAKHIPGVTVDDAYQRRAVERYDEMLAALAQFNAHVRREMMREVNEMWNMPSPDGFAKWLAEQMKEEG